MTLTTNGSREWVGTSIKAPRYHWNMAVLEGLDFVQLMSGLNSGELAIIF
jgi:hypothetical protein